MKYTFIILLIFSATVSRANTCETKEILNDEGDYLACEINIDGIKHQEKISDSGCAAFCDLEKIKKIEGAHQGDTIKGTKK